MGVFFPTECGALTCLAGVACLSPSLWILNNLCRSREYEPSCSPPSTSWNLVAWDARASLTSVVLTSGTRSRMACLSPVALTSSLASKSTMCPMPLIPRMEIRSPGGDLCGGQVLYSFPLVKAPGKTPLLMPVFFCLSRGRSPDWYNKVFGHLCAMEVAKIRDSFPTLPAAGLETKL